MVATIFSNSASALSKVGDFEALLILETLVGRGGVCGFWGAGQGTTTRNGCSIPRNCNAAMRSNKPCNSPRSELTHWGATKITQHFVLKLKVDYLCERSTAVSRLNSGSGNFRHCAQW